MIRTVGLLFLASSAVIFAQAPCERLKALSLPNVTITLAQIASAGQYTFLRPVTLPARCNVRAALTPSSDSQIEIELWLPVENWNGKFEAVGNGGWSGGIPTQTKKTG